MLFIHGTQDEHGDVGKFEKWWGTCGTRRA